MKLRNKKTGEIGELQITEKHCAVLVGNGTASCGIEIYSSLAELNEEWEDYEEPKEHWAIDQFGEPINVSSLSRLQLEKLHRLGNDFPSENATMKAIEKLNAWKRLKDKGFRFEGYDDGYKHDFNSGHIEFYVKNDAEVLNDLDLLFSQEDD